MDLISIIVPVYNTGKYLPRCIGSIVNQSYCNLEIIIIDDGSQEYTASICDELAAKDPRISVYHKQNKGVSVARNYGLERVRGSFVGFVDSDDWIDCSMYQSLYDKAVETNADIVYCDAQTIYDNGKSEADTWECYPKSRTIEVEEIKPEELRIMAGSVWRGLYRTSVIGTIRFAENLVFSEDRFFNLQCISESTSISYVKTPYYYRFMRIGSCVNSYHQDAVNTIKDASTLIISFVSKHYGDQFVKEYEMQTMALTLQCLYGVFASSHTFYGKYREMRNIASDEFLQGFVQKYNPSDVRLQLMRCKMYLPLYVLMWLHHKIKQG